MGYELMVVSYAGQDRPNANHRSPPHGTTRRERRQARRLQAAELFATGVRQAEVARRLGVARQSVHLWYRRLGMPPMLPRQEQPAPLNV